MISSYDFGLISELFFFLRSPQRVMIGVAGLLFPIDGTHEQQLAGYSSALVLFYLSPRVVLYFSFTVPCLDVNTPFFLLLLTDMSLFFDHACVMSLIHSDALHPLEHTQSVLIVY